MHGATIKVIFSIDFNSTCHLKFHENRSCEPGCSYRRLDRRKLRSLNSRFSHKIVCKMEVTCYSIPYVLTFTFAGCGSCDSRSQLCCSFFRPLVLLVSLLLDVVSMTVLPTEYPYCFLLAETHGR